MIKIWSFEFFSPPGREAPDYTDQDTVQNAFEYNLSTIAALENRGFEGVFFSEHHFAASLSPNPNLLVAALSSRTERLKLGVMGNVLPFHQPHRLFEDLAMLDYLTGGRLEIGVASGIPPEFMVMGMPQAEIRPRFAEILDFLSEAERSLEVTFKGQFIDMQDVTLMPRPRKESRRRHWMTIYSEGSARDAARRGFKICTGYQSCESAKAVFDGYRKEAADQGRDAGPDDIALRRQIVIGDTHEEGVALNLDLRDAAIARFDHVTKALEERLKKAGGSLIDPVQSRGIRDAAFVEHAPTPADSRKGPGPKHVEVSDDEFICGSPETVAEQIIEQCRHTGAGHVLSYQSIAMTEAQLNRNYDLWEKVIPILNKAEPSREMAA